MKKFLRQLIKLENIWQIGSMAFLFLIPWQTRYIFEKDCLGGKIVDYWSFSLYATDILLFITLIVWLITLKKKNTLKLPTTLSVMTIALLVALFTTLYWAIEKDIMIFYFILFVKAIVILLILLKSNISKHKIYWAIFLGGVVQAIFSIYQFTTQKVPEISWLGVFERNPSELGVTVIEAGERILRSYGAFVSPNILGGFLVITFFVGILIYLNTQQKNLKIILDVLLTIVLFGLFFSFSRSAWLALLIGLITSLIYFFITKHKKKFELLKIFIIVILILAICTGIFNKLVFTRINAEQRLEEISVSERLDQYSQAKELAQKKWQFGYGLGNYTKALHQKIDSSLESYQYQPIHNTYVLAFLELGLMSSIVLLLFLFFVFIKAIKKPLTTGLIISVLILMLFDHYFWTQSFGIIIFFITIAIIFLENRKNDTLSS